MATEFTGEIHQLADELPMLPADVTSVVARYEDEAAAVDVIKARMRAGGFSEMGELRQ